MPRRDFLNHLAHANVHAVWLLTDSIHTIWTASTRFLYGTISTGVGGRFTIFNPPRELDAIYRPIRWGVKLFLRLRIGKFAK